MPAYDFHCTTHGTTTVVRPMAEAGAPHHCPTCGARARRLYPPVPCIMRPSGYNRRPGEPGYSDFRRELELGEIKEPGPDSDLSAGWREPDDPPLRIDPRDLDPDKVQRVAELARQVRSDGLA